MKFKKILSLDLSLAHFDSTRDIVLVSGAGEYGIGAVILHKYEDGNMKAVAHASRSFYQQKKVTVKLRKRH